MNSTIRNHYKRIGTSILEAMMSTVRILQIGATVRNPFEIPFILYVDIQAISKVG